MMTILRLEVYLRLLEGIVSIPSSPDGKIFELRLIWLLTRTLLGKGVSNVSFEHRERLPRRKE